MFDVLYTVIKRAFLGHFFINEGSTTLLLPFLTVELTILNFSLIINLIYTIPFAESTGVAISATTFERKRFPLKIIFYDL